MGSKRSPDNFPRLRLALSATLLNDRPYPRYPGIQPSYGCKSPHLFRHILGFVTMSAYQ